ncbi:hypothetical protein EIP86_006457 [Pleurotus ostreatoroseus]|nr:hypothetical protein EIP86_006457 [Pleurotus ostreatoroseus]
MSLVASLFDIMVQQWLREYRTPTNSSVREAVRLREMRRRAFTDWAVPAIVSIIPILLELALVLFFIGQCQLFAAVNKTVFVPFAVFLGIALLMFTIATVMPLFSRTCAYKSPTSFAVLWVLKGALTTLSAVVTAGIYVYMLVAAWVISRVAATFMPALRPKAQIWATDASKSFWNFWVNINRPLRRTAINRRSSGSEYWVARERDVLQHEEHLDERALSWALPWLPQEKLPLLRRCFADLCPEERIRVVVKWIAQTLNSSTRRLRVDRGSDLDFGVLDKIDEHFADWYCEALMDVLPKKWMESTAPVECKYGPTVLIILQRIATGPRKNDATFVSEYIARLMALRASQQLKIDSDSSIHDHHHPDHISYWITFFDVLLASAATTLCIVAKHPQWLSDDPTLASNITKIIDGLGEFVKRDKERICALASNARKWCTDGVAFATLPAIEAICASVVALAQAGYLWKDHASPVRSLVHELAGLFAEHKVFIPAGAVLSELDVIQGGGLRSPSEAKEEFLADPVVPRMGYTPKYLPSSP